MKRYERGAAAWVVAEAVAEESRPEEELTVLAVE